MKPKRSPLIQGGLEIPMVVSAQWNNARSLAILKERTERSHILSRKLYVDDSKSILAEIKGEVIDINCDSDNDKDELEISV